MRFDSFFGSEGDSASFKVTCEADLEGRVAVFSKVRSSNFQLSSQQEVLDKAKICEIKISHLSWKDDFKSMVV